MKKLKTILQDTVSEIEEKKSKFIANVFYVESVEEAEQKLKEIKKKYFNAKHHCRQMMENQVEQQALQCLIFYKRMIYLMF